MLTCDYPERFKPEMSTLAPTLQSLSCFFRMLIAEYQNISKVEYRIEYNCCCEHLTFLFKRATLNSQYREKKNQHEDID